MVRDKGEEDTMIQVASAAFQHLSDSGIKAFLVVLFPPPPEQLSSSNQLEGHNTYLEQKSKKGKYLK